MRDKFLMYKRIVLKEITMFKKVCLEFYFKTPVDGNKCDTIIFSKIDTIFSINFEEYDESRPNDSIRILYKFKNNFSR